jgi:predicted aminopeptidase
MRRPIAVLLALLAVAPALASCSPAYLLRAGYEEARILRRRQPIARMIADPATPEERRGKLRLVLEARAYAQDSLRLDVGKSYTLFSEVKKDTLALVLSAARRDTFAAYTWWFPVVGRIPYKGFFSEAEAKAEQRRLEARGYDTYLRPTAAFSTLGWFTDPLLSTLLRYDSLALGNTVIHEVTHNTVYVPGQAMWNESFATFVGGRGAIDFFCGREGPDSRHCRDATAEWEDQRVYGAFLSEVVQQLETVYARKDLTPDEKFRQREAVFQRARDDFRQRVRPRLRVATFDSFDRSPLNNATLISRRLYYGRLELFEAVYRSRGGDLRRTVAEIVAAAKAGKRDPYAATEALLGPGRGL